MKGKERKGYLQECTCREQMKASDLGGDATPVLELTWETNHRFNKLEVLIAELTPAWVAGILADFGEITRNLYFNFRILQRIPRHQVVIGVNGVNILFAHGRRAWGRGKSVPGFLWKFDL